MSAANKEELKNRIAMAAALESADLVLKGGRVFNVFTKSWETADVAICGHTIVGIGSYQGKKELDVTGLYLTPGLMDAHVHFESSMLAPREMAKILLLNGVTGAVIDPHEIANVMGIDGLQFILRETEDPFFCVCDDSQLCAGYGSGYVRRMSFGRRNGCGLPPAFACAGSGRNDECSGCLAKTGTGHGQTAAVC